MKRLFTFLSAAFVAVLFSANAYAQDLATAAETYKNAAEAFNSGNKVEALAGFQKALEEAMALGDEGAELATECKKLIPTVLLSLGKECVTNKDMDKAVDYLNQAATLGKEFEQTEVEGEAKELIPVVLMADGDSMLNEGKYAEAAARYNEVLAINPENATAYIRTGMCQAKLGNEAAAVEAYTKAAEKGEKDAAYKQLNTMYANKAITAFKAKDNAGALENALKAGEYGENLNAAKIGGIAAFNLKKNDTAIKLLEQVAKANPNATDVKYYLARAYEAKGNKAKAVENYKKIVGDAKFKAFAEQKIKALGA